jgi:hypothetical protein
MTRHCSAHGRFNRAIKQRQLWNGELAAREMRVLSLSVRSISSV